MSDLWADPDYVRDELESRGPETCSEHGPTCPGAAGGDHILSMLRCSECGVILDDGSCPTHGLLDPEAAAWNREGDPAWNGAFDRW